MATAVIMPALGMAQETGRLVRWLKQDGENVAKGEPLMEIETDKAIMEIEAPATGRLGNLRAREGDDVPVGQTIAWLLEEGERAPEAAPVPQMLPIAEIPPTPQEKTPSRAQSERAIDVSVVARNMAAEQGVDLTRVHPLGKRIEKADILAYMKDHHHPGGETGQAGRTDGARLLPASPKARRLARERGLDLAQIAGSGPGGAVLTADVLDAMNQGTEMPVSQAIGGNPAENISTTWRLMAERTTSSWTSTPHFYLVREVNASRLIEWRNELGPEVEKQAGIKLTYTDLLVKLLAAALKNHPRLTSGWDSGRIQYHQEINLNLAVAVEEGLVTPVIHQADKLSLGELSVIRKDLVERAQSRQLRPADLAGGTFTLTNLGMYQVDVFNAIINPPQAAILAVGRIADRVVAIDGQPAVKPTIILSLSCDHRLVDGARGAQFLDEISKNIENPWRLLL